MTETVWIQKSSIIWSLAVLRLRLNHCLSRECHSSLSR